MEQHTPAPGWYTDPAAPGLRRYWDGQRWTDSTAPGASSPTTSPQSIGPAGAGGPPGPPPTTGAGWPTGPPFSTQGARPPSAAGSDRWASQPASTSDAYYQRAYAQFDAGESKVVWNWAAFLFGAFWYLFRGMWVKALLFAGVVIFSGGMLAVPAWIYGALMGTYDDYLLRRRGTQGW